MRKYLLTLAAMAGGLSLAACATTAPETPADVPPVAEAVPMPSAPLDTEQTLTRIGIGSCNQQANDQSFWETVAASNPDLFLYIGDTVYSENSSGAATLPELREAYGTLAGSAEFAAFRQKTPILTTWDDHDFGQHDGGASFPYRAEAERLFDYVWAVPKSAPSGNRPGVYNAHIVGDEAGRRVQIILLDTRYFRSDLKPTDDPMAPGRERYLPDPDPAKTMLGEAQWAWLEQELKKPADLRIIASSIQVIADGHGWEAWRTLPEERARLFALLGAAGAENVVFVSGDRHAAGLYRRNLVAPFPLYELTTSSLNDPLSNRLDVAAPGFPREAGPYRLGEMYYDANFGLIDIDWEEETIGLKIIDGSGAVVREKTVPLSELRPVY